MISTTAGRGALDALLGSYANHQFSSSVLADSDKEMQIFPKVSE